MASTVTGPMSAYATPVSPLLAQDPITRAIYDQLATISDVLTSTQNMIPQAATRPPAALRDGLIRLSRAPWRPVAGQTADAWVYYDGSSATWKLLPTAPS